MEVIAGVALPIFKLVKVPNDVILGWAAVCKVPVIAVDWNVVNPEPAVPFKVIPPTVVKDPNVKD
jgi:hypothetical protein